jgi:hypothetical protein
MPVLNESGFPKAAFPPQKVEEARNHFGKWLRFAGVIWRKKDTKQLLDRIADAPCGSLALGLRILPSLTPQPGLDKRFDMGREFLPFLRANPLCKLSEPEQDRHPSKNVPRGVVSLAEPYNVTLDCVANPGCTDSVDSGRADEIAVQHENLLSAREAQEIIVRSRKDYVPGRNAIRPVGTPVHTLPAT